MKVKKLQAQYMKLVMFFVLNLFVFSNLLAQSVGSLRFAEVSGSVSLSSNDSLQLSEIPPRAEIVNYIVVDPNRPNLMLDSLIEKITVKDNNFIAWIDFANTLLQKKEIVHSPTKYVRPGWVLGVLAFIFVTLGLVRVFFYHTFINVINSFYSERAFANISKEDTILTSWPYIFLYIIFSLSLGLFVLLFQSSVVGVGILTIVNFFKISGIIALLFIVKVFIIRFLALIFEIEKIAREYVAMLYLLYFNSVLILLPILVFATFSFERYFIFLLIIFAVIISLLFVYRFLVVALKLFVGKKFSVFYLILYLCALEIAPILILVKTLNN